MQRPDFLEVEHLWEFLDRRVTQCSPAPTSKTRKRREDLVEEWCSIPPAELQRFVESVPRHADADQAALVHLESYWKNTMLFFSFSIPPVKTINLPAGFEIRWPGVFKPFLIRHRLIFYWPPSHGSYFILLLSLFCCETPADAIWMLCPSTEQICEFLFFFVYLCVSSVLASLWARTHTSGTLPLRLVSDWRGACCHISSSLPSLPSFISLPWKLKK